VTRYDPAKPSTCAVFLAFFRLGLTAFGGPAMVNHIRKLAVEDQGWLTPEDFRDGIALCQTLPGAIAVNVAAYAGFRARKLPGLLAAFAGFSLPAFLLMVGLSAAYFRTREIPQVTSLFQGLEVIVVAIILDAAVTFGRSALSSFRDWLLAGMGAVLLMLKANPFLVILGCGLLAVLLFRSTGTTAPPAASPKPTGFGPAATLGAGFASVLVLLAFTAPLLFQLAWIMAKIELFAFGGGYAALTLMFHEVVEAKGWLDHKALMDGVALGQLTPGPILNTAAFIGYAKAGIAGALFAFLGIFTPGLILVTGVLPVFDRVRANPLLARMVRGIISCFVGLLAFIAWSFAARIPWDLVRLAMGAAAFWALSKKIDLLWVVAGGGVAALLLL